MVEIVYDLGFNASIQTYTCTIPHHNGIKQESDPGVFPGMQGINPVSFPMSSRNSDSPYFKVRIKTTYMLQKPSILHLLFFLSVFLFSFRNADKDSRNLNTASPFIANQKEMVTDTGGQTVNIDSAQACINRFPAYMAQFGFTNPGGQSENIKIRKSAMLTTGESFNAQNLQNWLSATMAQYAAAGKTLVINVQLGVYDMNYLNTYQPDAAKRTAYNGRIAIFLMPADASTGQVVRALVAEPNGSGGSGGGTGYDLGGLQP